MCRNVTQANGFVKICCIIWVSDGKMVLELAGDCSDSRRFIYQKWATMIVEKMEYFAAGEEDTFDRLE